LIESGPAGEGARELACECADDFYGICARRAGCASVLMTQCIDTLQEIGCSDSSVCGSNCASNGAIDLDLARVVPVNNYSLNYLKFSVCFARHNEESLDRFGLVLMNRCSPRPGSNEEPFLLCPYWIPPETFTALAIPLNASYVRMEYCVYNDQDEEPHYHCLDNPQPIDFYGTEVFFPSSIDVAAAQAPFCANDLDCPGSYCDHLHQPPTCSPKQESQFLGPLASFMEPAYPV